MLTQPITSLSNRDLLAFLVGDNEADCLLMESEGCLSALVPDHNAGIAMLREPMTEYVQWRTPRLVLAASREFAKRCLAENLAMQDDVMSSASKVRQYLNLHVAGLEHEVFICMWMNAHNRLIEVDEMFRGTLTQTPVFLREIVKRGLVLNAASVIVAHNHPTGVGEPSQADRWITDQAKAALALVDIVLMDHFILANNEAVSFQERGWL